MPDIFNYDKYFVQATKGKRMAKTTDKIVCNDLPSALQAGIQIQSTMHQLGIRNVSIVITAQTDETAVRMTIENADVITDEPTEEIPEESEDVVSE